MSSPEAFPTSENPIPPPASKIEELKFDFGVARKELHHQDSFLAVPEKGLFAVFDGVSGPGGEVAAGKAADSIRNSFAELPKNLSTEELKNKMREALLKANQDVSGTIGTTGTVIIFTEAEVIVGHVGDSRLNVLYENNELEQITEDDGMIAPNLMPKFNDAIKRENLTEDEFNIFKRRNIIFQSLRGRSLDLHLYVVPRKKGAKYLLSTDGLHDNLTYTVHNGSTPSIREILTAPGNCQTLAENLVNAAWAKSQEDKEIKDSEEEKEEDLRAKKDDITALVIEPL